MNYGSRGLLSTGSTRILSSPNIRREAIMRESHCAATICTSSSGYIRR